MRTAKRSKSLGMVSEPLSESNLNAIAIILEIAGSSFDFEIAVSAGIFVGRLGLEKVLADGSLVEVLSEAHHLCGRFAFVEEGCQ
jgi:hypothetical protein